MSRFRIVHRGRASSGGASSVTYDTRFGTDAVTAASTGWFTFGLHSGNRRIWLDAVNGNDTTGTGLSAASAKKTLDAALATWTGSGFNPGDQLMVAPGSYTDNHTLNLSFHGGISATYPSAILSYDPADAANTAKYGKLTGANMPVITQTGASSLGMSAAGSSLSTESDHWLAIQGIAFASSSATTQGLSYTARHDGIVIQNCRFNNVQLSIENNDTGVIDNTATYNQTGNVSKCSFTDGWASNNNAQGIFIHFTKDFWLQDNVLVHCGWHIGSAREDATTGGAGVFGHANYYAATNASARIDRMFYADSAADGFNIRGPGIGTCISSLDEPIGGNIGGFSGSPQEAINGVVITVDDWFLWGGCNINLPDNPRGYAITSTNTLSGSYVNNVAAIDNPRLGLTNNYFINPYNGSEANISSITHSGTTATMTFDRPHKLNTGNKIYVTGASPTEYNVSNVAVTVTSTTTLTYTMASTPATNATSVGTYTSLPATFLTVSNVRTYNYATTFEVKSGTVPAIITTTYTGVISDALAPGTGNSVATGTTFPSYQTRDQIITTMLGQLGISAGSTKLARKAQLINAALYRPDLPWAQASLSLGFQAMGLTPVSTPITTLPTYTDTPATVYPTALGNLTLSSLSFTRGTPKSVTLSGMSALPYLTCSDLPSGFTLTGSTLAYDGSGSGAATPTIHIVETVTTETSESHSTAFALSIS